eukprot:12886109-Prorocentrum_lima.AAC.1
MAEGNRRRVTTAHVGNVVENIVTNYRERATVERVEKLAEAMRQDPELLEMLEAMWERRNNTRLCGSKELPRCSTK